MELCSLVECTGCLACVNSCPKNALKISVNAEGFYEPLLIADACVDCGLCERSCPILKKVEKTKTEQFGYAIWSRNNVTRKVSSSGGIFSELALYILRKGGVVFGVAFDQNFKVSHILVDRSEDLIKLRGSKYLQSDVGDSYQKVKILLKKGQFVLFSGTPCQIAGLYGYLNKDYENLITCDFVCHGVPSPSVFLKYKEWLEIKYNSSLINYSFRDKRKSWCWFNTKATFQSGEVYIGSWFKDPYMRLFLRDNILRKSCYHCHYTNMDRMGDVTIGDFWGYKASCKQDKDTDEGISMLLVNSSKGKKIFDEIKNDTIYFERSIESISVSQKSLSSPWKEPHTREDFWTDFKKMEFNDIIKKWGYSEKRNLPQFLISEFGSNLCTTSIGNLYYKLVRFLFR
ncbi:Coenzyme F420 hydrogenase/dehydrogenase, beta subunit C-terminal domain [Bacteroides sp.]|uniref:Coenzyme F420 hydrogenase/dehydrogenase, beta subunit C-terminal domain n=1 Tax=Bacteroides sp. TaxID=29523 RepID=UPI0026300275|nr:Coenzyme F420 hydrogenase/dehydrogenase, beta subunit C-terminal domain [Bacteroides sp.]MDD3040121.1 Coenzyme F420 hydrogenase/dehydrogenase, beta subunit C-terminal domain [Bacteroides sp.]